MTTIVLNGTSSAGKTSLAMALRARWPGPLQVSGVDTFLGCQSEAMFATADGPPTEGFTWVPTVVEGIEAVAVVPGPRGEAVLRAMQSFWAAAAREGIDQVVDQVLLSQVQADDLRAQLHGHDVLYVGVHCPLDVIDARERARGDRNVGQGRGIGATVHTFLSYDLELDSSQHSPEELAELVLVALRRRS